MGKKSKKRKSTDTSKLNQSLMEVDESTMEVDQNSTRSPIDDDESLIDFLVQNEQDVQQLNLEDSHEQDNVDETNEVDSEEDEENRYNGRVLNRKELCEEIYLKYAKDLYAVDKERVAKSLRKKIKVTLGEGKDKNVVFVNDEPIKIEEKVQLDHKETIALQLTQTRLGFSYFCSFYDKRFNRICFQPFKDKKEVIDHYYSLHLNKLKNYCCSDEKCRRSYVFYKQMKGHLIKEHGIYSNFDNHLEPISYYFETRCQVRTIKDKDLKVYRNRLIEKPS